MFLAMESFPHAAMWALWFQQAGGLLPADCVASAVCGSGAPAAQLAALTSVVGACGPAAKPPSSPLSHLCRVAALQCNLLTAVMIARARIGRGRLRARRQAAQCAPLADRVLQRIVAQHCQTAVPCRGVVHATCT